MLHLCSCWPVAPCLTQGRSQSCHHGLPGHDLSFRCLSDLTCYHSSLCSLCSSHTSLQDVFPITQASSGLKAFALALPSAQNSAPPESCIAPSIKSFCLCSNDFSIESTCLTIMWPSFSLTWLYLLSFPITKHVLQVCWLIPCLCLIILSELCEGCSITVSFAWRQVGTGWIMWNGRLLTQDMASLKHLGSSVPRSPHRRKMNLFHHSRNVDPEFPHFTPKESPDYKTKCWWHWLINPPKCPKGRERVLVQSKKPRFSFSCLHNPALFFFTAFVTIWNGSEAPSSHLTIPVFCISSFWNFPLLLIFLWGHHFPPLWVHMTWLA